MKIFQVHLEGLIDLLSNHLYSSNEVFLRELLQNAMDAITARKLQEPDCTPSVEVSYIHGSEEHPPTLLFEDAGVGLTEEEVQDFLTKIGASIKRRKDLDHHAFIGQFGIGLLSCFMVTRRIVMTTQSVKADYGLEWVGEEDGTYHYKKIAQRNSPGTSVYIQLKAELEHRFSPKRVKELLQHYGGLLNFPIYFQEEGQERVLLNYEHNPLEKEFGDFEQEQEALLEFGLEQFGEHFIAAIPLHLPSGDTKGVAFVRKKAHISGQPADKVYLKGMLVSDKIDNILPRWAFFLKSIVHTNRLQPTASRERFYQNEALTKTRNQLGRIIRNTLMQWQKTQPVILKKVIEAHERSIKEMAEEDDKFFKIVLPYLSFPTTRGRLSLPAIRRINPKIHYIYELETYQQVRSFAGAQDMLIVKTRYDNDMSLINKVRALYPDWDFKEMEVQDIFDQLQLLEPAEKKTVANFLKVAEEELLSLRCDVMIRKFEPTHIPTICYLEPGARLDRTSDLDSDNLPDTWLSLQKKLSVMNLSSQATLCINYRNPTIQRLLNIPSTELMALYIRYLYFQAILLGNYSLTKKELQMFSQGLMEMIDLHEKRSD